MPKSLHYFHDTASSCSIVVFILLWGLQHPIPELLCVFQCELTHALLEEGKACFQINKLTSAGSDNLTDSRWIFTWSLIMLWDTGLYLSVKDKSHLGRNMGILMESMVQDWDSVLRQILVQILDSSISNYRNLVNYLISLKHRTITWMCK